MADIEIFVKDNSGEIARQFKQLVQIALETVGTQAESHAKQIISDALVYGHVNLKAVGEKDNSRVDTGRMRNSIAHTVVKEDVYIGSNLEYAA